MAALSHGLLSLNCSWHSFTSPRAFSICLPIYCLPSNVSNHTLLSPLCPSASLVYRGPLCMLLNGRHPGFPRALQEWVGGRQSSPKLSTLWLTSCFQKMSGRGWKRNRRYVDWKPWTGAKVRLSELPCGPSLKKLPLTLCSSISGKGIPRWVVFLIELDAS